MNIELFPAYQYVNTFIFHQARHVSAGGAGRPRGSDINITKCKWSSKVNGRRGGKDDQRIIKEIEIQYRIV